MSSALATTVVGGNKITRLENGAQFYPKMLAARIILDAFGSRRLRRRHVRRLAAAGCEIAWHPRARWRRAHRLTNSTHREILVVDGRVEVSPSWHRSVWEKGLAWAVWTLAGQRWVLRLRRRPRG